MIPTIGVLIATYAVARLLQVPMEVYVPGSARWIFTALISAVAIVVIVFLTFSLLMSATSATLPRLP